MHVEGRFSARERANEDLPAMDETNLNAVLAQMPKPPRKRRRKILLAVAVGIVALVAALPTFLESSWARRWLLEKANDSLGTGLLNIDRFRFSWFGPTHLDGLSIRGTDGEMIVSSPNTVWDRNLFQILFLRPKLGTLTLDHPVVDLERRSDGSVDIVETLRPILKGQPETDFTLHLIEGSLRLSAPVLNAPIEAKRFNLTMRRPSAPEPISWSATLDHPQKGSLKITGHLDRWDGHPEDKNGLEIAVHVDHWPISAGSDALSINADVVGPFLASRKDGLWRIVATAESLAIEASGSSLHGDRLVDTIKGDVSLVESSQGWSMNTLDLSSSLAALKASGPIPSETDARIEGWIDLVALSKTMPHALSLREGMSLDRGRAELVIAATKQDSIRKWTAEARLADLAGHVDSTQVTLREPASVSLIAIETQGALAFDRLTIRSAFLTADGTGDLDQGVKISGNLDLAALQRQAEDFMTLGNVAISGSGPISAEFRRGTSGMTGQIDIKMDAASVGPPGDPIQIEGLRVEASNGHAMLHVDSARRAGLDLGPTNVSATFQEGAVTIVPIETTLNGGQLRLVPSLELGESPMFRLSEGTFLKDAEVNEQATQRVLAFVAPILDGATKARGKVSAQIDLAEFPLGPGARNEFVVEGNVVFDDVEFTPQLVAKELLGMLNRPGNPLRLNQPVELSISGGRVHQRGLAIPIGDVTEVTLEGSVGFDKTMDLVAMVPITDAMFPNRGLLGAFVSGTQVKVPISGTLDHPKVDRDAFRIAMLNMGRDVLLRSATQGAAEVLSRLVKPRDPNAPRPPTAAERKAKRLEKKMQKRGY